MQTDNEIDIFEYFMECVSENNSKEWNLFRKKNRKLSIIFDEKSLSKINLSEFNLKGISFFNSNFSEATFKNCIFDFCKLDKIQSFGAVFDQCSMVQASFVGGNYVTCNFLECDLRYSDFSKSRMHQSNMKFCKADNSLFKNVSFFDTCLASTTFTYSDFSGSDIKNVQMHHSDFTAISVDGETIFWDCYYDKKTNFTGVGLGSCRIEPVLLSSFQCNIRRIWWESWYNEKKDTITNYLKLFLKNPILNFIYLFKGIGNFIMDFIVKFFWWITDYGSSTVRLILVFFITTVAYALLYTINPHLTNDAILQTSSNNILVFIRSLYFSVIVMTGLGFGEINAYNLSYLGHIIILIQSLTGYILLGAFLVRIGILFQGEFPVSPVRKRHDDTDCDPEKGCNVSNDSDNL